VQYLHVFVSQIRRKIVPGTARPRYILTQPGIGYRLPRLMMGKRGCGADDRYYVEGLLLPPAKSGGLSHKDWGGSYSYRFLSTALWSTQPHEHTQSELRDMSGRAL
jgi:hypothetical protein